MTTIEPKTATKPIQAINVQQQNAALRADILSAVGRVIDHGQFILGPEVEALERQWAALCDTSHAVGVSNGTTALTLTLRALRVKSGDEVITAPNSFIASASAIVHAGARPRFADVGADYNLDPQAVERAITKQTRGIVVVHLGGRPAAMEALGVIAKRHGLWIVEDAAQAPSAKIHGQPVGSFGAAGCFSLHPLKTAGACGDAGIIVTNNGDLADRLRLLRNHGFTSRQEDCAHWGFNARLDAIQAAIVLTKLPHLQGWVTQRRANAAVYRENLPELVTLPPERAENFAVYQTFPILADQRDTLAEHLQSLDISTAVHYRVPMHLLDACVGLGYGVGDFPVAESQATRLLSLPIHEGLNESDILRVCEAVAGFYTR